MTFKTICMMSALIAGTGGIPGGYATAAGPGFPAGDGFPAYAAGTILSGADKATDAKEVILKKARAKIARHFSSGDYRFEVTARWIPRNLMAREAENIVAVELKGQVQRYTDFDVVYRDRGRRDKASIQLAVDIEKKLPVVIRRISRGEEIREGDLEEQWVSLGRNKGDLMEEAGMISGNKLRRTLLSGQPVRRSYLVREYIIDAGDRVKLIIEKRGVRVQLMGEARENGAEGDIISIYSNETRKKYKGEVIRPGITKWKQTL
ncbi:flagella basal body P-ring formation protein FlgA [Fodinibius roseus]|uniref:Flagella basal body P-ring formation protein FlgA n=1 Tax=Fodinibius roseus TaxID=1194090 RepID=A0A1M5HDI5_9BACT|nr:flagellar basal body P-ring formation chaperone FlgA [Fodinibius roseus]SHG14010.1 flagella basal body P-ring formation protein FlgA [Fodinibius roseus]